MVSQDTVHAIPQVPKEAFVFVLQTDVLNSNADDVLATKPRGYFADALHRFATNRGSVICFCIIIALFLYALFGPLCSSYNMTDKDGYYAYVTPKSLFFERFGFWDGSKTTEVNVQTYQYYQNIPGAIKKLYAQKTHLVAARPQTWYKIKLDTYAKVGWVKMLLTKAEFEAAKKYEAEQNVQLFYPLIDETLVHNSAYKNDMNAWFLTDARGMIQAEGGKSPQNIFLRTDDATRSDVDGYALYTLKMNGTQYETRVLYSEWYRYEHGHYAHFLFGADTAGYDIFTRLAYGARLSLFLSLCVSAINLCLGIVIGSLEGYYGGTFDLVVERIKDIVYEVPTQVTMTLFQLYLAKKVGPVISLFFAFIFYGWIGTSSTVRAQFYRFKGQDYVQASRTLGAKDSRLIFRHIFPNAIGFIITVSVLAIPGVIFSEATLTYLGIVNLDTDTLTSVGTMLNTARQALSTSPHAVFFPAAFISILLVCFNEFGNGLRDAFNPSLRGA